MADQDRERQRLVFGQDRICPRCGGRGSIDVKYRSPGMKEANTTTNPCARCDGKGRIE